MSFMSKAKTFLSKAEAGLSAWMREGAKDLHNALVPAFPTSARGIDEPGTPLNPTPQMVTDALKGYEAELDAAGSRPQPEQDRAMER